MRAVHQAEGHVHLQHVGLPRDVIQPDEKEVSGHIHELHRRREVAPGAVLRARAGAEEWAG